MILFSSHIYFTDGVLVTVKHHDFKAFTPLLDSRLFGLMYNNLTNLIS